MHDLRASFGRIKLGQADPSAVGDTAARPQLTAVPALAVPPEPVAALGVDIDIDTTHEAPTTSRRLCELLAEIRPLGRTELALIAGSQQRSGLPFGEAAVALGLVSPSDVQVALSRQFSFAVGAPGQPGVSPELVTLTDPAGLAAEHFRTLRSQLSMRLSATGAPARPLAVIGPGRGDGRTWCAANLAVSLAQRNGVSMGPTLLIDANLRNPRLASLFGLTAHVGLAAVLAGRADVSAIQRVGAVPGLYVLPAGLAPPNPLELLERPGLAHLLAQLQSRFTHIVIDTPAASRGADAAVIAALSGTALLLGRRHVSAIADIKALLAAVASSNAEVLGVMMNEH